MTEREVAQDELLCGLGFTLAGIIRRTMDDVPAADAVHELAMTLKAASVKQYDEDRNRVPRAMGKADCAEPHVVISCEMKGEGCERCSDAECNLREMASEVAELPDVPDVPTAETEEDTSPRLDLIAPVERRPCVPCGQATCIECPRTDCEGDERKQD